MMNTDTNNDTTPEWKKRKGFIPTIVVTGLFGLALFSTDKMFTNTVPTISQSAIRGFEVDVVGGIKGTLSWWQSDVTTLGQSCGYTNQKSTGSYMSTHTVCAENGGFNIQGSDCGACYRVHYQEGTTASGGTAGGASTNTVIMVTNAGGGPYRPGENDFDCFNSAYRKIVTTNKQTWWDITYEPVDCDTGGKGPAVSIEEAQFDGGSDKKINYLKILPYNLPTAIKDMSIVIGGKSSKLMRNGDQGIFVLYDQISSGGNASFSMTLKDGRSKTVSCNQKGSDLRTGSFCTGGGGDDPTPSSCEGWCESDRAGQGDRHCAPGDMANQCGGCSYCHSSALPCADWCGGDYQNKQDGRHCAPGGDMGNLCGGCSYCHSA